MNQWCDRFFGTNDVTASLAAAYRLAQERSPLNSCSTRPSIYYNSDAFCQCFLGLVIVPLTFSPPPTGCRGLAAWPSPSLSPILSPLAGNKANHVERDHHQTRNLKRKAPINMEPLTLLWVSFTVIFLKLTSRIFFSFKDSNEYFQPYYLWVKNSLKKPKKKSQLKKITWG